MEKHYLKSKGVEFEDVVLDRQPERLEEFMKVCSSRAVPCTHIVHEDGKEEQILGFDKQRLDTALDLT